MSYNGFDDEEQINRWLKNVSEEDDYVADDSYLVDASDSQTLTRHNEAYSELLGLYVENYRKSSQHKRRVRIAMCILSMAILLAVTAVLVVVSIWAVKRGIRTYKDVLSVLAPFITALGSFVGVFMTIPQIIASYLFDKDEEDHLNDIIKNIQDYDSKIRERRK